MVKLLYPPSKCLHRALKVMSANAAEECPIYSDTPTRKTVFNDSSCSSMKSSSYIAIERKDCNGLGEQCVEPLGNGVSAFCSSSNSNSEECNKSSEADICNQLIDATIQEACKGVDLKAMDHDDCSDCKGPCCVTHTVCTAVQASSQHLTQNLDRRKACLESNHGSLDPMLCPKEEGISDNTRLGDFGAESPVNELETSEHSGTRPNQISLIVEAAKCASQSGKNVVQCSAQDPSCENTLSLKSHVDDNTKANGMFEVAKDVKPDQRKKEASYVSVSDGHLDDKDTLGQSSPFLGDGIESPTRTSPRTTSICHVSTSESANHVQNSGFSSPNAHLHSNKTVCSAVIDGEKIGLAMSQSSTSTGKCRNYSEARAALSSFEVMLGSLIRTKESIGRATRMAIDCSKLSISSKVVEILARSLESESSLHRRVDLFFLVDSITQCSWCLKGGTYPSLVQAVSPRLLSAAAPPGSYALENQRQCLKVLRLWLERKILPESIVHHHIRELDSFGGSASAGPYSCCSARTERALDDPVRDMEGMLVDEYGSNSSFQLPGFFMPQMLKDEDEGSDSDGGSFEAVTPERNCETPEERVTTPAIEKHTHILEDVDGELEMEDVAPACEVEMRSASGIAGINVAQNSPEQFGQHFSPPFVPPMPHNVPPSSPPLPSSPPPPPPPPLPPPPAASVPPSCNMQDDPRELVSQHSVVPRINPSISNAVHYHAPECRDLMQAQLCDTTGSFSNYAGWPLNSSQHTDGSSFRHNSCPPRPLPPPPSNQFSYVPPGQHVKSQRETSYPNRFQFSHIVDGSNFYNNHDRMRSAPYEQHDESWRFPAAHFPGPPCPDEAKSSYAHVRYGGPLWEQPRLPHQDWAYPSQGMHHRNFMPSRSPSESAFPVANRVPSIWQPR